MRIQQPPNDQAQRPGCEQREHPGRWSLMFDGLKRLNAMEPVYVSAHTLNVPEQRLAVDTEHVQGFQHVIL